MDNELLAAAWSTWQTGLATGPAHAGAVVALGYAACAGLMVVAASAARRLGDSSRPWGLAATLLLVMGLDALYRLDLLAIGLLRELARAQGWYAQRRAVQTVVVVALGLALAIAGTRLRRQPVRQSLTGTALAGLALLLALALLRGVSLHATDLWLQARLAGASVGRQLEAVGLLLAGLGAVHRLRAR